MSLYNLTKTTGDTGYGSELYTFLTFLNESAITADSVNDLTQKTLINPVFTGAITGNYTFGGTPTITSPTINSGVLSGTFTGDQTFSGTTTLENPVLNGVVIGDAVSTTGGNNKILKTDTNGNIILTGGLTAEGESSIKDLSISPSISSDLLSSADYTTKQIVFELTMPSSGYFLGDIELYATSIGNSKVLHTKIGVSLAFYLNTRKDVAVKNVIFNNNVGIGYLKLFYYVNTNMLLVVIRSNSPGSITAHLALNSLLKNVTALTTRNELNYDYSTDGYIEF